MEKCILFISELPDELHGGQRGLSVPVGLSNIYSTAQRMNAVYGITGIFSYKAGYYLGVIEGEKAHIDQLYRNILADDRHRNVLTVIDTEIEHRSFQDWSMSLIVPVSSNQDFVGFVDRMTPRLKESPESHLKLFGIFFPTFLVPINGASMSESVSESVSNTRLGAATDSEADAGQDGVRIEYKKWAYRLTAWPNFSGIEVSATMLGICTLLVRRRTTYQSLLESEPTLVADDLDRILAIFNGTGLLRISVPDQTTSRPRSPATDPYSSTKNRSGSSRGSRGFLSKLKGLIATGAG